MEILIRVFSVLYVTHIRNKCMSCMKYSQHIIFWFSTSGSARLVQRTGWVSDTDLVSRNAILVQYLCHSKVDCFNSKCLSCAHVRDRHISRGRGLDLQIKASVINLISMSDVSHVVSSLLGFEIFIFESEKDGKKGSATGP